MASSCDGIESDFAQLRLTNVRETGRKLGGGWWGEVREADMCGTRCAKKRLHNVFGQGRNKPLMEYIAACHTWSRMTHDNIVQFLGVVFEEGSTLPALVLEILPTSLRIHLETSNKREFLIEQKIKVLHHVALGLVYLHEQNQVHLNLSTNNILYHPVHGIAKITDIGLARPISRDKELQTGSSIVPGTPAFMPPEFEVFDVPLTYSDRADVFSFGCVILSTLSHAWPQPRATKAKKEGRLIALSELERRQHLFDKIEQKEETHFGWLVALCLEEEANSRPDSERMEKELVVIQAYYHGSSSKEQVCEPEAMVSKLEESNADAKVKNGELMRTSVERTSHMKGQPAAEENGATSERKEEEFEIPRAKHDSHSSGGPPPTQPQERSTTEQASSESRKVKEIVLEDSSYRKQPPTNDQERSTKVREQEKHMHLTSESKMEKEAVRVSVHRKQAPTQSKAHKGWKDGSKKEKDRKIVYVVTDHGAHVQQRSAFKQDSRAKGRTTTTTGKKEAKTKRQPFTGQSLECAPVPPAEGALRSMPSMLDLETAVVFRKIGQPFQEFMTSYPACIDIDGKMYASCENYLLAQKYAGTGIESAIQMAPDVLTARKLCQFTKVRYDWKAIRDTAMELALSAKFTQHEDLHQLLLSTKPHSIVYHIKSDDYWGDGGDGRGQNRLGEMLMQLRGGDGL